MWYVLTHNCILAVTEVINRLKCIDLERLGQEEDSKDGAGIFLVSENRINFMIIQGTGGNKNEKIKIRGVRGRKQYLDSWISRALGLCGNLVNWKIPGVYEGDPSEDSS